MNLISQVQVALKKNAARYKINLKWLSFSQHDFTAYWNKSDCETD